MSTPAPNAARDARILADLQDAVGRMHVVARHPRIVVCAGPRTQGARPMAWQVLFERSLGPDVPTLHYRGVAADALPHVLAHRFDSEPTLGQPWAHARLVDAMQQGPVIQAFRADRLPDDVAQALVGLLIFEEDGLDRESVLALLDEHLRPD